MIAPVTHDATADVILLAIYVAALASFVAFRYKGSHTERPGSCECKGLDPVFIRHTDGQTIRLPKCIGFEAWRLNQRYGIDLLGGACRGTTDEPYIEVSSRSAARMESLGYDRLEGQALRFKPKSI